MNKKITIKLFAMGMCLLIGMGLLLTNLADAARVQPTYFKRTDDLSGTSFISFRDSNWEFGSTSDRIAKIYATNFDVSSSFILGGTIGSGGLDGGNNAITNVSYVQAVYFNATGTTSGATSTFQGDVVIATSTAISGYDLTVWGDMAVGTNMTPKLTINTDGELTAATTTISEGDFTVDTSTFYVDVDNNRTGFGTTTPTNLVHIYDSTATSTAYINSGGSGLGGRIIIEDNDGAGCTAITTIDGTVNGATVACP